MFDIEQISEWRGQDVLDPEDNRVGRLEEIYHDKHAGSPGFACVKTGLFGRRLSFVPLTGASMARDHIRVAYPADQIKHAPSAEPDGRLTAEEESRLFDHYGLQPPIDPELNSPRLVRYQTDAAAAEVADARQLVVDQGTVVGPTPAIAADAGVDQGTVVGPTSTIAADADRLAALEERVAAIENWLAGGAAGGAADRTA